MSGSKAPAVDEVAYVNGRTRLFGIVGDPIEQVKSPELFGAEFERRGINALMLPIHVRPSDFDKALAGLMRIANLDGLVFTIPHKVRAMELASSFGDNGSKVGAINALRRDAKGGWHGDIFDGIGCVEAFKRRGIALRGKSVLLLGAGGAGSAIAVALAHEGPEKIRIFDPETKRAVELVARVSAVDSRIDVAVGPAELDGADVLMNASPVGMLSDPRLPFDIGSLPKGTVVFDAIVKPTTTPLLKLAEDHGCAVVRGKEMMLGQISKMVDFFGYEGSGT